MGTVEVRVNKTTVKVVPVEGKGRPASIRYAVEYTLFLIFTSVVENRRLTATFELESVEEFERELREALAGFVERVSRLKVVGCILAGRN